MHMYECVCVLDFEYIRISITRLNVLSEIDGNIKVTLKPFFFFYNAFIFNLILIYTIKSPAR